MVHHTWFRPTTSNELVKTSKQQPTLTVSDFDIETKIGAGHFGKIYRATYRKKVYVALKRFSKDKIRKGTRGTELLKREVSIHSQIQHSNIISFMGCFTDTSHVSLVLEYAPRGDLLQYMTRIESADQRLVESRVFLRQIMDAVQHLADLRIAHRDIKPENILMVQRDRVKLCDFGWSVEYTPDEPRNTLCGTPEYVAPEILARQSYNARFVDLWSVGVLAFEFYFGETPFSAVGQKATFDKIRRFKGFAVLPTDRNQDYKDFVARLLQVDPEARMLAHQALHHPFLKRVEI